MYVRLRSFLIQQMYAFAQRSVILIFLLSLNFNIFLNFCFFSNPTFAFFRTLSELILYY